MRLLLTIVLVAAGLFLVQPSRGEDKVARQPVIVELFTSEGCSSCPPADELLAEFLHKQPVEGAQIIPLAFHVDYWNRLGWTDRFSDPKFTARQQAYAQAMKLRSMYTPQMIVDGRHEFVGSDGEAARKAIGQASRERKGDVTLTLDGNRIHVQVSNLVSKQECEVLLAITEDDLQSDVRHGENAGHKLAHVAVVRRLIPLGKAHGVEGSADWELAVDREWNPQKIRLVAFIQEPNHGPILGAASIPLQK